jgi:hypothetical protein
MGHNMLAVSRIYNNITLIELGNLLGTSAAKARRTMRTERVARARSFTCSIAGQAEELARSMIEAKQMTGTIDQVEGLLEFKDSASAPPCTLSSAAFR